MNNATPLTRGRDALLDALRRMSPLLPADPQMRTEKNLRHLVRSKQEFALKALQHAVEHLRGATDAAAQLPSCAAHDEQIALLNDLQSALKEHRKLVEATKQLYPMPRDQPRERAEPLLHLTCSKDYLQHLPTEDAKRAFCEMRAFKIPPRIAFNLLSGRIDALRRTPLDEVTQARLKAWRAQRAE